MLHINAIISKKGFFLIAIYLYKIPVIFAVNDVPKYKQRNSCCETYPS